MMSINTNEIRSTFFNFFTKNGHTKVESSPLVPLNDPSLLFTNAGMVQFKDIFIGSVKPPKIPRAVTSQKCLRAGGKHNDLENVGYTSRHHTFFEMLGNFSFGDYFKEDAIEYAWELITKEFDLKKERILVTIYHDDNESHSLWKKIANLSDDKIIRIKGSDNFWTMGNVGPCGPCSEIFFDHGEKIYGGPPGSKHEDGDRFVEIWNLVFMQYEQLESGDRKLLPKPSIDTGMGLERMAAVLQGKQDNYETDIFTKIIESSKSFSRSDDQEKNETSHRIIADHLRAAAFMIADGILPSNEGRGYVLRRIMRRALRHVQKVNDNESVMWKLVAVLTNEMGEAFPELIRAKSLIESTLESEESRFKETLKKGLKLLEDETKNIKKEGVLPGSVAFKLYDTYGFPIDLTKDILKSEGYKLDEFGFANLMKQQKKIAKSSWKGLSKNETDNVWIELKEQYGNTEFLGYDIANTEAKIYAILNVNNELLEFADENSGEIEILFNQTPFYAESGGQIGDIGIIKNDNGDVFKVVRTELRRDGMFSHIGSVSAGTISVNDIMSLNIDTDRRKNIRIHHSSTHLLHQSLRRILGDHVSQKGSLVTDKKLRFDFSHTTSLSDEQIKNLEHLINQEILANSKVETKLMSIESARESGALALFGEKYSEEVRVVEIGLGRGSSDRNAYSIELCGGTHVNQTGDIGIFKILTESALGSGVRRIEAAAGSSALSLFQNNMEMVNKISKKLKIDSNLIIRRMDQLIEEKTKTEKELNKIKNKEVVNNLDYGINSQHIHGITIISNTLNNVAAKDLKGLADSLKVKVESGIVILGTDFENKGSLVVGVTKNLISSYDAVELLKIGVKSLGGQGGGGRPDMAQGGGPKGELIKEAVQSIIEVIEKTPKTN